MMRSSEFDCPSPLPVKKTAQTGFSLVELSVVLAIISIVAVMGLEMTANYMNRTAYTVTVDRLEAIDKAIVAYRKVFLKLPCPGLNTQPAGSACYGKECNATTWAAGTNCTTGTTGCADNGSTCRSSAFGSLSYGDVPVRDLGLPLSMMTDGYGNRFVYVVTTAQTRSTTFSATADAITVRSGKPDNDCTTGTPLCQDRGLASYFLFSAGNDKRGSRTANGTITRSCQDDVARTDGQVDTVNCRLGAATTLVKNGSTAITIPNDVFYDSRFNNGTTDAHFDDLVKWRAKGAL